jgi:hypothetical protein
MKVLEHLKALWANPKVKLALFGLASALAGHYGLAAL